MTKPKKRQKKKFEKKSQTKRESKDRKKMNFFLQKFRFLHK